MRRPFMHSIRSRALAPLLAMALVALPARAQTIGGIVRDSITHLPAQRVNVHVIGPDGAVLAKTETDTTGVFYALLTAPARVRLHFDIAGAVGFDSDTMTVGEDQFIQREFVIAIPRVLSRFQVEKQAYQIPGVGAMRYPDELKQDGVSGEVVAEFVVDTTGRAQMETFSVVRSSDVRFIPAVRAGLASLRFHPAEVNGQKVRQLVQQPFAFRFTGVRVEAVELPPLGPPMHGPDI